MLEAGVPKQICEGDPLAGITLLSTLQEPCVASGNTFAERSKYYSCASPLFVTASPCKQGFVACANISWPQS